MTRYGISLSEEAELDLQEYIDYIIQDCKAPLTALRHYEDLFNVLRSLEYLPERYVIQKSASFLRYGPNARRVNFKKMAIIYTVHGDVVYIHRILPSSLITNRDDQLLSCCLDKSGKVYFRFVNCSLHFFGCLVHKHSNSCVTTIILAALFHFKPARTISSFNRIASYQHFNKRVFDSLRVFVVFH